MADEKRLTWEQIEKKAMSDEGIDNVEWMEAARRHIDNQKREIKRLREQVSKMTPAYRASLEWDQPDDAEALRRG